MNLKKHYSAGVVAFVIWGFFPIPLKALDQFSAGQILYFRILASFAVLAAILPFKWSDIISGWKLLHLLPAKGKRTAVVLTLAGAVLLTINWLTFIYIVNNINVKTASFSYLVCPVLTAVLGYALLGERLSVIQWIAVGLCGLSCLIMGLNSRLELGYSVLTALTYALYLTSQRKNQGFDRIVILFIQVLFSLVILSAMFPLLVDSVPSEGKFYGIIILIAIVFTVLPLFLNLFALNRINAATIGILMYLNPLINFVIAFVLFHEQISGLQLSGYLVIVFALIVFNYHNFKKIQSAVSTSKV